MDKAMTRTRLVLVEDDQDGREALSIILGEKYTVFGYASAVEALEAIDTAKPDLLLLDICMHPVDGLQCLKMIRATPGYRDIPAVALTGFARDVERQRFLNEGLQAVVVKPVLDLVGLIAVIDRLANSTAPAPPASRDTRRSSALPAPSAAGAGLDGGTALTASALGGAGETDGQEPA
jgi:CheY-like chemotaxis protein